MNELQNATVASSARLVKQMVRDLRWHSARLDDPASIEAVLSLGGTISESVKKLAAILEDEPTAPERKRKASGERFEMKAIRNFLDFAESLNADT